MEMIVNKVAESGIITLDLSQYIPKDEKIGAFDLKPFLFKEMILREKDFRAALLNFDWQQYSEKQVAIFCSVDAIIPIWAYMLVASYLQPVSTSVFLGTTDLLKKEKLLENLRQIETQQFLDKRVVIKGCGEISIPDEAYVEITAKLRPFVKSLMYGEPCSTVPIFKRR
ncbi:MAG: DUF2480 family protein [Bacteroidetes bacterium]|nr:DUF2480 family protein [Bacteroidota bacterium]MBS1739542.1 DUF2480 family protein [Bacteroidota bacterium]MBS1777443.1 DUF2480 family protein [Bacteroidota bacterium]